MDKLDDSLYDNTDFNTKKEYGMHILDPNSKNLMKLIQTINKLIEKNNELTVTNEVLSSYIYNEIKEKH